MHKLARTPRRKPRLNAARLLAFSSICLVLGSGCRTVVVADCPKPSPIEAQDLSEWLLEWEDRPAKDWAARVVGAMYPEELEEVRREPIPD